MEKQAENKQIWSAQIKSKMPVDFYCVYLETYAREELTETEKDIITYLLQTKLNVFEISQEMGMTVDTLKKNQQKIFRKIRMKTRVEMLVSYIHFLEDSL